MVGFFKKYFRKLRQVLSKNIKANHYDFNKSNPLGGNGERVDIQLNKPVDFNSMDIYQKNHWKRYEFAKEIINANDICGDFACGTGYGSVMLAGKASSVTGADMNTGVIVTIKERYKKYNTVNFLNENLLNLNFADHFDNIISFETLEHFDETDISKLLAIFSRALKKKRQVDLLNTIYAGTK